MVGRRAGDVPRLDRGRAPGALFRLASHTGARRSELLGLRWSHVDLAPATISIASRRTRVGYRMVDRPGTKTAAGARVVDLDADTLDVLKLWRKAQAAEREAWGSAYVESGYVFTDESGQPLHADHVANRFDRLLRKASVPTIRFHDLRHTHATLLLKAGVPVHVVAQRLGHSSPALTLSIYSHVLPRQQWAAAMAFARLVSAPSCIECGEKLSLSTEHAPLAALAESTTDWLLTSRSVESQLRGLFLAYRTTVRSS